MIPQGRYFDQVTAHAPTFGNDRAIARYISQSVFNGSLRFPPMFINSIASMISKHILSTASVHVASSSLTVHVYTIMVRTWSAGGLDRKKIRGMSTNNSNEARTRAYNTRKDKWDAGKIRASWRIDTHAQHYT